MSKPILCLDFDGVIHSYTNGWKGADVISDPPVPGTKDFIEEALEVFEITIFSSRTMQPGGLVAMKSWFDTVLDLDHERVKWATEKPAAFITIDDRALTFRGNWNDFDIQGLLQFKPWNKE